ncbi:hypothetical protein LO763_11310 [Glycomyces sp. A-F 0318]|uniref:hypothetical protein n=1 Tax=Glycomyces amatae TaxID=2881355 RepID=UPI001E41F912|nr:hypothetical protein [Glycomyces amatae]MCD0444210.1 hypothetical protein [Glycomyces amatae]
MLAAQGFLIAAIAISLISLGQTVAHLWDDAYLVPNAGDGPKHAQFHFQREAMGDLGHIAVMLLAIFAPAGERGPLLWWILAVTTASYYGAYWTGHLLIGTGAPNRYARAVHIAVSSCGATALALSYTHFR